MNFSDALAQLKAGQRVKRSGEAYWLCMDTYNEGTSRMTLPYIFIYDEVTEMQVPYVVTQIDLFAEDFEVLP